MRALQKWEHERKIYGMSTYLASAHWGGGCSCMSLDGWKPKNVLIMKTMMKNERPWALGGSSGRFARLPLLSQVC